MAGDDTELHRSLQQGVMKLEVTTDGSLAKDAGRMLRGMRLMDVKQPHWTLHVQSRGSDTPYCDAFWEDILPACKAEPLRHLRHLYIQGQLVAYEQLAGLDMDGAFPGLRMLTLDRCLMHGSSGGVIHRKVHTLQLKQVSLSGEEDAACWQPSALPALQTLHVLPCIADPINDNPSHDAARSILRGFASQLKQLTCRDADVAWVLFQPRMCADGKPLMQEQFRALQQFEAPGLQVTDTEVQQLLALPALTSLSVSRFDLQKVYSRQLCKWQRLAIVEPTEGDLARLPLSADCRLVFGTWARGARGMSPASAMQRLREQSRAREPRARGPDGKWLPRGQQTNDTRTKQEQERGPMKKARVA